MTLHVKQATVVTESLREAFARLMPQLSARLSAPDEVCLRTIVDTPTTALLVAEADARIVGVLTIVWYDVPSGRKAWIEDVVVDAAARGCGVGRVLVQAALNKAVEVGASQVLLTSSPARESARALYRSLGFKEAETSVFVFKTEQ